MIASATSIVLVGLGAWSAHWIRALQEVLPEFEALRPLFLDQNAECAKKLPCTLRNVGSFAVWQNRQSLEHLSDAEVAIICVPAKSHLRVLEGLLRDTPHMQHVICEKPGGDSLLDFSRMRSLCEQRNVALTVADHYILRPQVQLLLQDGGVSRQMLNARQMDASMLEAGSTGPPEQDASLDMLVHPLNLLHLFNPGGRLEPDLCCFGRGVKSPNARVTYCQVEGRWITAGNHIPIRIEVGKQLRDEKRLQLTLSDATRMEFNLSAGNEWSYAPLLQAVVEGRQSGLETKGGVSAGTMQQVWNELELVQSRMSQIELYSPGRAPDCRRVRRAFSGTAVNRVEALYTRAKRAVEIAGERVLYATVRPDLVTDQLIDDLVTPVDKEVEAWLQSRLHEPGVIFLGEESGTEEQLLEQLHAGGRCWIVDPVDGTQNLAAGRPEVAVSVALYEDGKAVFGVLRLPVRRMTAALRHPGELEVNDMIWTALRDPPSSLSDAVVALPGDVRRVRSSLLPVLFSEMAKQVASIRVTGALAYDLAALAMGEIDVRLSTSAKLVDVAAGQHMVEGLGGRVTDWTGRPWRPGANGLLAARTQELHEQVLAIARRIDRTQLRRL